MFSTMRRAPRKCFVRILAGLVIFTFISQTVSWLANSALDRSSIPIHHSPLPNIDSLSTSGKRILERLVIEEDLFACPSRATFVIPWTKQDPKSTTPFILWLQKANCSVHVLVEFQKAERVKDFLKTILSPTSDVSVFPKNFEANGSALALLQHAKFVRTPWTWIMEEIDTEATKKFDLPQWVELFRWVPGIDIPVGVHGARLSESGFRCAPRTGRPEPVAFLTPPFLAPTSALVQAEPGVVSNTPDNLWASLGERIYRINGLNMGGVLLPAAPPTLESCQTPHTWKTGADNGISNHVVDSFAARFHPPVRDRLQLAFLLPNMQSMHLLAPTACRMLRHGHDVYILVRAGLTRKSAGGSSDQLFVDSRCNLRYDLDMSSTPEEGGFALPRGIATWCSTASQGPKVLMITEIDDKTGREQLPLAKRICQDAVAVVDLPFSDLQDSEWLSMLTPEEWQAWNTPQIELAVVTHNRPWSLNRLLDSIKQAHYFGDAVNIAINLEQTADSETRHIVEAFSMNSSDGHIGVRHRIVYAGLMAAVVESWYPHGNHSYGVLLEDDVELSPMFYAWTKFSILRYRYNSLNNVSSQLYGISLYQAKVSELHLEGRRPFNPASMFGELRMEHPHTPYLSQVPCSWGAVYFPEHWREFQQYLALRLSEYLIPVGEVVVPDLRSNRWSRSWKKFFNEMVFLRGYVSLYPNYDHFVSLSTNHLEMGDHVPANVNREKQMQYFLPLMMHTGTARHYPGTARGVTLLDLPLADLPQWNVLPVLDLWGDLSSLEKLQAIGLARRTAMSVCDVDEAHEDALRFLCPSGRPTLSVDYPQKTRELTLLDDDGPDLMQG